MKIAAVVVLLGACNISTSSNDPGPDAAVVTPDAAAEPKPAFTAGTEIGGSIAIDDTTIRETYKLNGNTMSSTILVSLTDTATQKSCGVTLGPKFVQFGTASTSTRHFKTVVIDFAHSKVILDKCGWDDAWILSQLDQQFGNYIVGFSQARFTEDQPYLDVYLDAVQPFPNQTANITLTGAGMAYAMAADGTVSGTVIQPPGGTLLPGLYDF